MVSYDVRDFIADLEEIHELIGIDNADWDLEIGTICELMAEKKGGPALLFDSIKGYPRGYRVLSNLMNTYPRVATTLGLPPDMGPIELARTVKDKLKGAGSLEPVETSDVPCRENVQAGDQVDLFKFPTPKFHERDGGRYIGTACLVVTRDPDEGWVNVGTYRVQIHDRSTLGLYVSPGHHARIMREKYWALGKSCPVVVVAGVHPNLVVAGSTSVPWGVEEYGWMGWFTGKPVEIFYGDETGLPIPASSEIVLEGESPPPTVESKEEGPFGEWTGYYASGARNECVIKVKRVYHRNEPIITAAPMLVPPRESASSAVFRASYIWGELERAGIPDVKGVYMMPAGGVRYICVISIRQRRPGHAKQALLAACSGEGGGYDGKFVIAVDDDIDITDDDAVLWAVATRCEPESAVDILRGCWSTPLQPSMHPDKKAKGDFTNSRCLINACRPWDWRDRFPLATLSSPERRKAVAEKWKSTFDALAEKLRA